MKQSLVPQAKVHKRMGDAVVNSIQMYGLAIVIAMLAAFLIRGIVLVLERRHRDNASLAAVGAVGGGPRRSPALPRAPAETGGWGGAGGSDEIDEGHVAAISAAVYAVLGAHRVVRIEPAGGPAGGRSSGWAAQGRWLHHTTRRKPTR
ncbi:MAG: hypothetical protein GVY13_14620 [Alphaproteobacteria bacterium]|jgi:hypothetical protein|nr:hypothetical protein [Alphaproteobacteria bacterium]